MKLNWRYIAFVVVLAGLFLLFVVNMPKNINWFITFYHNDKNPFGCFILNNLLENSWYEEVNKSNLTFYELASNLSEENLVSFSQDFSISEDEIDLINKYVAEGNNILIAAHQFDSIFYKSYHFETNELIPALFDFELWKTDSMGIKFVAEGFEQKQEFYYPSQILPVHFTTLDSSRTTVVATNTDHDPVIISLNIGEGNLLIASIPLAFTNYGVIHDKNNILASNTFSYLNGPRLHWTEYYEMGRMESITPLRYILREPPLKWALYTTMLSIIVFMIFEAKRKQRVIPIIEPLKNTTLAFVKTISRLYYIRRDHRDLALKKVLFFTDFIRQNLYIDTNDKIDIIAERISLRTNISKEEITKLFIEIQRITGASQIGDGELRRLVIQIDSIINRISNYK